MKDNYATKFSNGGYKSGLGYSAGHHYDMNLYNVEEDHPDYSPFVINGETYAMYKDREANERSKTLTERRLERVSTELSNVCKTCLDDGNNWCPTINFTGGYCCSEEDYSNCPN